MTALEPAVSGNAGLLVLLEAGELRRHLVGAERQQRRAIEPVGVGDDDAFGARCRCCGP